MPRFHPIYDTALTLLGIINLIAGIRWVSVPALDAVLILTGLLILGIELSRIYTALWMLGCYVDPHPGEEVLPDDIEETSERIECPRCEVVQFRRAA